MASESLNELMNSLLPFAEQMLREHGAFYPFAAKKTTEGEIVQVGAMGESDHPPSQELIDLLVKGFSREAVDGQLLATGICLDSRFRSSSDAEPTDAICCRLESREGEAIAVYVPYKVSKKLLKREYTVEMGEIVATSLVPQIFSKQA